MVGQSLFLAGDEAHCVERLTPGRYGCGENHQRFPLADFVDLHDPDAEMDVEGLAECDGWLWVTGSHSRTRHDPRDDGAEPDYIDLAKLADLKDTRPRCLLARISLLDREAGLVAQKKDHGSKLGRYMAKDPLISPSLRMAVKEGGLDIEGIAAAGPERIS